MAITYGRLLKEDSYLLLQEDGSKIIIQRGEMVLHLSDSSGNMELFLSGSSGNMQLLLTNEGGGN